jgi:hypothetical protein
MSKYGQVLNDRERVRRLTVSEGYTKKRTAGIARHCTRSSESKGHGVTVCSQIVAGAKCQDPAEVSPKRRKLQSSILYVGSILLARNIWNLSVLK